MRKNKWPLQLGFASVQISDCHCTHSNILDSGSILQHNITRSFCLVLVFWNLLTTQLSILWRHPFVNIQKERGILCWRLLRTPKVLKFHAWLSKAWNVKINNFKVRNDNQINSSININQTDFKSKHVTQCKTL